MIIKNQSVYNYKVDIKNLSGNLNLFPVENLPAQGFSENLPAVSGVIDSNSSFVSWEIFNSASNEELISDISFVKFANIELLGPDNKLITYQQISKDSKSYDFRGIDLQSLSNQIYNDPSALKNFKLKLVVGDIYNNVSTGLYFLSYPENKIDSVTTDVASRIFFNVSGSQGFTSYGLFVSESFVSDLSDSSLFEDVKTYGPDSSLIYYPKSSKKYFYSILPVDS